MEGCPRRSCPKRKLIKEIAHNLYALPELSNRPTCEFMQLVPFEWPFAAMR